jgi:origin recognition complex subunit 5
VVDNAEALARSPLLPVLASLRELSAAAAGAAANVAVVFIGRSSWTSGPLGRVPPPGAAVHFPPYAREEAAALLALDGPAAAPGHPPALYANFADTVVLQHFGRLSRSAADLRAVAAALLPAYVAPLKSRALPAPRSDKDYAALFTRVRDHVRSAVEAFEPGAAAPAASWASGSAPGGASGGGGGGASTSAAAAAATNGGAEDAGEAAEPLGLPRAAQLLLLAAHVASRNRPTTDRQMFDPDARVGRLRGRGGMGQDRLAEAAKEARLKGPHTFALARLEMIFRVLLRNEAPEAPDFLSGADYLRQEAAARRHAASAAATAADADSTDVKLALGTLVALQLLGAVGDEGLSAPRYQCLAPEALVLSVADAVGVHLGAYIRYA